MAQSLSRRPQAALTLLTAARREKTDSGTGPLLAQWLENNRRHPAAARVLAAVLWVGKNQEIE